VEVSAFETAYQEAQADNINRSAQAATIPESKDVSQDMDSLIEDMAAVASAILGGGSEIASAASSEAAGLEPSSLSVNPLPLGGGSASASSVLREVSGQVQQATSIVGGILADATSIVGSILAAATSPSNIGVLPDANSKYSMNGTASLPSSLMPSTMSEPQECLPQSVLCSTCNSSRLTFPYDTTTLTTQCLSVSFASATSWLGSSSTTPSCPNMITETCTVTETWHSTHYDETATLYTFIANTTVTRTETVR
jgi:hypothetical protein